MNTNSTSVTGRKPQHGIIVPPVILHLQEAAFVAKAINQAYALVITMLACCQRITFIEIPQLLGIVSSPSLIAIPVHIANGPKAPQYLQYGISAHHTKLVN